MLDAHNLARGPDHARKARGDVARAGTDIEHAAAFWHRRRKELELERKSLDSLRQEQLQQVEQAAREGEQAEQEQIGLIAEFWDFLIHNKKWWLTPIILVLLLVVLLVMVGGSSAAPFIYTLF